MAFDRRGKMVAREANGPGTAVTVRGSTQEVETPMPDKRSESYWYVYCSPCDWTGPQRETRGDAIDDREEHIAKHERGRLGVHLREDISEGVE